MKPIIIVENLSKQYRLGNIGTGTLSHDLRRWYHRMRGLEDPYLKIGETNDRTKKGTSEYVWALKDINFEVMPGEILGIIGKNGAGKSTLLKILSKVTGPTTGGIHYNGRIASLLEVGTGFHPELTGRENIYLNGAILGMTKTEIKSKLDEIIDFSGVERYIDTPVKRYSSGMMVRLGFAVAAHLEPEILVVDEVLAVGDAEFQKKAIGKMQDVSNKEGRTVLFVSHNLSSIEKLCHRTIVLKNGGINFEGKTNEAIRSYLANMSNQSKNIMENIIILDEVVLIKKVTVNESECQNIIITGNNSTLEVRIIGTLYEKQNMCFEILLKNEREEPLALFNKEFAEFEMPTYEAGEFEIVRKISLPKKMNKGIYFIDIQLTKPLEKFYVLISNAITLNCSGYISNSGFTYRYKDAGVMLLE
ncbi:ABC transporter ATP-binding protein [Emticicia sp.]|uniref:ABC transporter ATP-binding protein n=1 Tax=Emticicia sp. TaxID=1930953 RepID=UPI0037523F52